MRIVFLVLTALLLISPTIASAQSFVLNGSGGPTMHDSGYSLAAGFGFSPTSRLTFVLDVERTHLSSRVRTDDHGVTSAFRGGTVTLAAPALHVSLLGRDRIGPYSLVGLAAGLSRPNVTDLFPNHITTEVRAPFVGGGIQVPLRGRVTLFAEARMMLLIAKEADDLFALAPIRGGIAWRF